MDVSLNNEEFSNKISPVAQPLATQIQYEVAWWNYFLLAEQLSKLYMFLLAYLFHSNSHFFQRFHKLPRRDQLFMLLECLFKFKFWKKLGAGEVGPTLNPKTFIKKKN